MPAHLTDPVPPPLHVLYRALTCIGKVERPSGTVKLVRQVGQAGRGLTESFPSRTWNGEMHAEP